MHAYLVARGTDGKMIDQTGKQPATKDWTTRRNLFFTETIVDPIRYHNNRGNISWPPHLEKLAQRGYTVFGGHDGGDASAKYLLAVPYGDVTVK